MTVRIICHMISSIDGKLLPSQWSKALSPIDISAVYEKVASSFEAQGWMIGRKTMAEYDAGVHEKQPATMDCTLGKNIFKGAKVFDIYQGEHIEAGKKSMAYRIILQDENQTLTDEVIDKEMTKIRDGLVKSVAGLSLR